MSTCPHPPGSVSTPEFAYTGAEWQERLRLAVERTLQQKAAKKADREAKQIRRNYGLAQRHARKLARNQQEKEIKEP